jgi:hypothetical protein
VKGTKATEREGAGKEQLLGSYTRAKIKNPVPFLLLFFSNIYSFLKPYPPPFLFIYLDGRCDVLRFKQQQLVDEGLQLCEQLCTSGKMLISFRD